MNLSQPAGDAVRDHAVAVPSGDPVTDRRWQTLDVRAAGTGDLTVTVRGTGEGNVLGGAFWTELEDLLSLLRDPARTGGMILRGQGSTFSRGLDLRWYLIRLRRARRADASGMLVAQDIQRLQGVVNALASTPRVVIALITGECTGAALELVTACDLRIATRSARFCLPELDLGVVPDLGGLQRLPGLVGQGTARRLVLTGEVLTAEQALRAGLVSEVHDSPAQALSAAERLCAVVGRKPPEAVAEVKALLEAALADQVHAGLDRVTRWNSEQAGTAQWERRMSDRLTSSSPPPTSPSAQRD